MLIFKLFRINIDTFRVRTVYVAIVSEIYIVLMLTCPRLVDHNFVEKSTGFVVTVVAPRALKCKETPSVFHISMLFLYCPQIRFRCRWPITQRTVRTDCVVRPEPTSEEHFCFIQRVEYLPVEQFVRHRPVK